MARDLLIKSTH